MEGVPPAAEQLNAQIARLEEGLAERFGKHPAAKTIRSMPGLGMILGARVPGEFGDDPNRYADARLAPLGRTACKKLLDTYGPWDV